MIVIVITVVVMMVPPMNCPKVNVVPVAVAFVVSVNPMVMLVVTGHPDVMPSVIPELWAFVIRAVADVNFQTNRLCRRAEHRTHRDQDGQEE